MANGGSEPVLFVVASQVDGFMIEIVDGPDVTDRAAARPHEDGMSDGGRSDQFDAREKRTVADAGGTEDGTVTLDEIVHVPGPAQVLFG
jgi:hypothetical protein